MSSGAWKPNPTKEAQRLIEAAKRQGYEVTSIQIDADGGIRLGLRRPGERDKTAETPEDLRAQL